MDAPVERSAPQYIPGMDGLRALALAWVVSAHTITYYPPFPSGWLDRSVAFVFGAGWVCLDLFFVLSGFLITGILFAARNTRHRFFNFYLRRALRIFPVYYLYLALMFVWILVRHQHSLSALDWASVSFYFYNFRVIWLDHPSAYFGHLWSMNVEEHFYLLWPLLVFNLNRRILMRICVGGALLSLLLRIAVTHSSIGIRGSYVLTPCRLDGLLLGSWLALAALDPALWARVKRYYAAVAIASFLCLVLMAIRQGHFYSMILPNTFPGIRSSEFLITWGITPLALFCGWVVITAGSGGPITQFLELPFLRWLGKRSYGIYIFHFFVVTTLGRHLAASPRLASMPAWVSESFVAAVSLTLSTFIGAISYQFFELPFLRLKKRFPAQRAPVPVESRPRESMPQESMPSLDPRLVMTGATPASSFAEPG
jgi:peptidoglycan/LPS O-acetylase OafA/YrhL